MRSFLVRRWFLLLLVGGVGLSLWRPGWVRPVVDPLSPRAVVASSLFLMAWGLESRRLLQAILRPGPALWALAVSYGLLPALAWLVGPLLPLPDLRIGLLIITSVPCTLASAAIWTRLGGGNEAIALLAILLSTSTSWLATPFWLARTTGTYAATDTGSMMAGLFLVLIVPVGLAQLSRAIPAVVRTVRRGQTLIGTASRLLVCTMMLKGVVAVADHTSGLTVDVLLLTGAVSLGLHLTALAFGVITGRTLGFGRPECIAIAFSCSQKTLPVALFLYEEYYKGECPLAVVALVFYHVGQLVIDTFIADAWTRRPREIPPPLNRANALARLHPSEKEKFVEKVHLREKFARITEHWKPKIVGELNGQQVKLVKFQGPFVWHHHEDEDELFLVVQGRFRMEFRDRQVWLEEGEFLVVPRGVEHRPVADEEAHVLLFEPASTLNTGNVRNERTVEQLEKI
jgi:predicted Na+-dependent transporter/mannose-6-phosphate isomerase-like protein (cupin superfamily)